MVILGLLLLAIGALAVVSAVFVSDGTAELLGMDLSALAIFLIGLAAGVCILWGFTTLKFGTKRGLRQRREHRELAKLSEKLDRVEADRRADDDNPE